MIPSGPALAGLAAIALEELGRRRAAATRKVAAGAMRAGDANALLLPWLALACRLGADLPELADDLAALRACPGSRRDPARPERVEGFFTEAELHVTVADAIAPLAQIRATLADAREDALERCERAQVAPSEDEARPSRERARGLCALASVFGVPMSTRSAEAERSAA